MSHFPRLFSFLYWIVSDLFSDPNEGPHGAAVNLPLDLDQDLQYIYLAVQDPDAHFNFRIHAGSLQCTFKMFFFYA